MSTAIAARRAAGRVRGRRARSGCCSRSCSSGGSTAARSTRCWSPGASPSCCSSWPATSSAPPTCRSTRRLAATAASTCRHVARRTSRLFIIALVGRAAWSAIWFFLNRAARRAGGCARSCRTASSPPAPASPPTRSTARTFFIGSGLAGVAGVALTLLGSIGPTLGTNYIVDAFLVVVVGGLGQLRGAVIAALALGVLNSFVEYWTQASAGQGGRVRRASSRSSSSGRRASSSLRQREAST